MQNQTTNRSHTPKYITPRKTTLKKKKLPHPTNNRNNHNNNNLNRNLYNITSNLWSNFNSSSGGNRTKQNSRGYEYEHENENENGQLQEYKQDQDLCKLEGRNYRQSDSCGGREWKIEDFQLIRQMGRGKFGYVYAAKEKQSDYLVAIKKMSKTQLKDNNFEQQVKRQITIQASINHPNILKLYNYFWDQTSVYLILQYAPQGELFTILQHHRKLPQPQVSIILRQICQGLLHLHQNNIIHRDIKPENILVSGGTVKIGDFGWSVHCGGGGRRDTLCGTLDYLAPEIVVGGTHDVMVDVWQVGVLGYELAVGRPPFQTESNERTYQRILNQEVQFPGFVSYQLRQFIKKILNKNPQKRLQCKQILEEPFILKYMNRQLKLK